MQIWITKKPSLHSPLTDKKRILSRYLYEIKGYGLGYAIGFPNMQ